MSDVQIAVIDQQDTQIVLAVPGVQGATGSEIPTGGTADQVLRKNSSTNYDTNWSQVTSAMIADGTIVNADVNAGAAIAGTKISPDFGGQAVTTTGQINGARVNVTGNTEPTNGLYLPAANSVALSTNGTGRLFVDASGNVGVGTASPQSKASVLTTSVPASNPTWSDSWISIGPNVGSATGAALGLGYDSSGDEGYLVSLAPGVAFKPLNIQASIIKFQAGTSGEDARIDSSGRLLVGTSSAYDVAGGSGYTPRFQVVGSTEQDASLLTARTDGSAYLVLANLGGGSVVSNGETLGVINFKGNDGNSYPDFASIKAEVDGTPGDNDCPGRLVFSTTADGASSPTEQFRIASTGRASFNGTPAGAGRVSIRYPGNSQDGLTFIESTGTTGSNFIEFRNSSNIVAGSISHTGTTTVAYNTSSDYRLKENVTPVTDGITRLQQLKPSRFNFITDPAKTVDGFLAHEVQAIVPEAITGEKDAVDDEGNPVYQGIDQSKLVPLLTAALQEAIAKIESLEARLDAANL